MKKIIKILILSLILSNLVEAQSTERFIRILGNSEKEIEADKAKIYFSISEVKANKFDKKSKDASFNDVYKNLVSKLSELNILEVELKKSLKRKNSYNKKTELFYIETDKNNVEKVTDIKLNGFRVSEINYVYTKTDPNLESELSIKAIKDAKRKAKAICKNIDKKLGKILNIEIKDGDCCSKTKENKNISTTKKYKVSITFKLID